MPTCPKTAFTGNFIDAEKIRGYTHTAARRIPSPQMRDRFARVIYDVLRDDPRNARPVEPMELANAPDWAIRDHVNGKSVHAFDPDASAVAIIKSTARALRATCEELDFYTNAEKGALSTRQRVIRQMVKEFHAKVSRMPFSVIMQKAHLFQAERRRRLDEMKADEVLFPREEIFVAPGRRWERLRSSAALGALGCEMHNCLADGSPQHRRYARSLRGGTASFWVLRDHLGVALMAAMIDTATGRMREVRGPRNASVRADDPDFTALMTARASSPVGACGLLHLERRRACN